jgi:hypothetical protein
MLSVVNAGVSWKRAGACREEGGEEQAVTLLLHELIHHGKEDREC